MWDFLIEIVRSPDLRGLLLALLVLAGLAIIMLLLLVQSGLIAVKFSYGGLGVELHHLHCLVFQV